MQKNMGARVFISRHRITGRNRSVKVANKSCLILTGSLSENYVNKFKLHYGRN
jgi:hypothetical protein